MGSFETVAVTFVVCPCSSVCAALGVRAIETACKLIVSVMLLVVSATDVAVIVTVAFAAIGEGAVYVTEVVVCPLSAPRPVKLQVTPLLDLSFATVAVNSHSLARNRGLRTARRETNGDRTGSPAATGKEAQRADTQRTHQ